MRNDARAVGSVDKALDMIKRDYLDEEGFIVQKNRDGGDSLNRLGHLYFLLSLLGYDQDLHGRTLRNGFQAQLAKLTVTPGLYRRHWDKNKWYYNEQTTSRDQYTPIVITAGLLGDIEVIKDIIEYLTRNGCYPNSDLLLPGNVAELLRGRGNISSLQPFNKYSLADLDCAQVYMARFRAMRHVGPAPSDSGSDDLNTTLTLLYGLTVNPTSNLEAAAYEYFNANQKPIERLKYYFRPENNGPPLDDVYEVAIQKVLQQHPLKQINESSGCNVKMSEIMKWIADKAWKRVKVCSKPFDKRFKQDVTKVDFDFTNEYLALTIGVMAICKTSQSALIESEGNLDGEIKLRVNLGTCQVENAKANLKVKVKGPFGMDIPIASLEKNIKKEAQLQLQKVCCPNKK